MLKGGGGRESFGVVFPWKHELLAILKGGGGEAQKVSTLLKGGGREKFYPVLPCLTLWGGGGAQKVSSFCSPPSPRN